MKKTKYRFIIWTLLLSFISISCSKDDNTVPDWEWDKDDEHPIDEVKPRFIWVDAAANFPDFANNPANIARDLKRAKEAGFTDVVVDVRPTCGDVLFKSSTGHPVEWLGAWLPTGYTKIERTEGFDYLGKFIEEGKKLELNIYAGFNTFVGGTRGILGDNGQIFENTKVKNMATQLFIDNKLINMIDYESNGSIFLNPIDNRVQEYVIAMLKDLANYQGLKGIILDRGRFYGIESDFSSLAQEKFQKYIGQELPNFPQGILDKSNMKIYKKWLEFRAKTVYDFMARAKQAVTAIQPAINFGVYVGGWYSTYYQVGVNWASKEYDPSFTYGSWASKEYYKTGYGNLMDIILIGAYASPDRIYGDSEWSVEGFCKLAKKKMTKNTLVVGGPDVGNGKWATSSERLVNRAITESVDAAMKSCDGYFLFDMIHIKQKNQWGYVKTGIDNYLGTNK